MHNKQFLTLTLTLYTFVAYRDSGFLAILTAPANPLPDSTWITFDQTLFNAASNYNTGTGIFTVTIAGVLISSITNNFA